MVSEEEKKTPSTRLTIGQKSRLVKLLGGTVAASGIVRGGACENLFVFRGPGYASASVRLFTPDHDASDDYLVLEYFRDVYAAPHRSWKLFCEAVSAEWCARGEDLAYRVGDYARAALRIGP